jgi:hypothetical protein
MARTRTRNTAKSAADAVPAAGAEAEPLYYKTTTSWRAGEGEQDQPRSGRMGDEETTSAAEPVHTVTGIEGLSGGTTSN